MSKDLSGRARAVLGLPGLLCFWNFQEEAGRDRIAQGRHACRLREMAGPVERTGSGLFGDHAARLVRGRYLEIPRSECPALDIRGPRATMTLMAWIQRHRKPEIQCEAIAAMWDESRAKRQYGLFLDLRIFQSADQVGAHVSATGGPTPGHKYCMDVAIGQTCIEYHDQWEMVGFTYDSQEVRVYRNGLLDARGGRNPFAYPGGLLVGGPEGADFTVGAVHRGGEMGNFFTGLLGGLLVCEVALSEDDVLNLARATVPERIAATREALARGAAQYDTIS